ncbi:unnamed protein product [Linum tenue]|uniref:Uncharacterized protein n=1 Tax=Linum tenue TaxID=586396 RepID=A0AAV0RA84_9ROSI|nr:unnamed protein product [Linum tenue]
MSHRKFNFSPPPARQLAVRGVQVPAAEVHAGVRLRPLLPARPAGEVRQRPPRLRRQQRRQAAQRDPRRAARRRRQLPRLRGRGPAQRPGLRLRRLHLQAPAPPQAAPIGPPPRPTGARQVHRPSRPAPYFLRFRRPKLPRKPLCFRPLDVAAAAAAADQLPDDGYSDRVGFTRYDPRKYPTSAAAAAISSPASNAADVRGCPATGDVEGL